MTTTRQCKLTRDNQGTKIRAGKNSTSTSLYTNLNDLAMKQSNTTSRVQTVDQLVYEGFNLFTRIEHIKSSMK